MRNLTEALDARRRWETALGASGFSCIGWPTEYGGRGADLTQQVLFAEEYARAGGPNRIGHIGVELAGPTIIALGTDAQRARFLPAIARGEEIWCQAYSEPDAGSDLANVRCVARLEGDAWVIEGQKVWTSLAHYADWAFALCRTERGSRGREGLSYLLVPMKQDGVDVRPIRQMTGESEFNEVFFDGARTGVGNIVGAPGDGWRVAMTTLGFERGVSTLGHCYKLYWASWHRKLGELAVDVLGSSAEIGDEGYRFGALTTLWLSSRADTIYAGTNQIQRNIIAERALGLPREARG